MRLLLEHGARSDVTNNDHLTALRLSLRHVNADIIKVLAHYSELNNLAAEESVLFEATRREMVDMVKVLVDAGADVNLRNEHGWSAF